MEGLCRTKRRWRYWVARQLSSPCCSGCISRSSINGEPTIRVGPRSDSTPHKTGSHFRWRNFGGTVKASTKWYSGSGVFLAMGGPMGTILLIMSVPWLAATGIYNPHVMHHGRCIAEPDLLTRSTVRHPRQLCRTTRSTHEDKRGRFRPAQSLLGLAFAIGPHTAGVRAIFFVGPAPARLKRKPAAALNAGT